MKWCSTHFRWEFWSRGKMYAWLTGEADERDQRLFQEKIVNLILDGQTPRPLPHT